MAPMGSSNRSVRIADAVSIYEPDSPQPTTHYSMNTGGRYSHHNHTNTKGGSHFIRSRASTTNTASSSKKTSHSNHHQHAAAAGGGGGGEHRSPFFLNKLFRNGSSKTPYNSFRHNNNNNNNSTGSNNSHDDRSQNDESTYASSHCIQLITSEPMVDYDTGTLNTEIISNNRDMTDHIQLTSMMMPPSPFVTDSSKKRLQVQQQQQAQPEPVKPQPPERRKFFMDKLFTVSRMHVSEAGITTLSNGPSNNSSKNINDNKNVRRSYKLNAKEPLIKSRITYSVDGDTTTTNSSVGVDDEDINDLSSKESNEPPKTQEPNERQSSSPTATIIPTHAVETKHSPTSTTTILLELPTPDHAVMEIQTDRCVDTPPIQIDASVVTTTTTIKPSSMRIVKTIPSTNQYQTNNLNNSSHTPLYENFKWNAPSTSKPSPPTAPVFSLPLEQEMSSKISVPTSLQKVLEPKNALQSKNVTPRSSCSNFWGVTSTTPTTTSKKQRNKTEMDELPKSYFGTILDKVTKIQCITNCSDIDLARCDDTVEDYIASPLNTATTRCSGNKNRSRVLVKHRMSTNSLLQREDPSFASNSLYTVDDDEYDDVGTYDDSMISASLFDIDTMEDEYTYTTTENDDGDDYDRPHNTSNYDIRKSIADLPLHLQKSLLSEPSCNSSKYMGDDDATSFSSQNSAWL